MGSFLDDLKNFGCDVNGKRVNLGGGSGGNSSSGGGGGCLTAIIIIGVLVYIFSR